MFLFRQGVLTSWRRDLSERKILRSLRNNAIQGRCRVIRRSEPVHWVYHGVGVCKLWEWISGCWDRGRGLQDTAILAGQANLVLGCLLGYTGSIPPSLLDYQKEQTKCSSLQSTFLYFDTSYDAKLLPHHLSTSPESAHSRRERLK